MDVTWYYNDHHQLTIIMLYAGFPTSITTSKTFYRILIVYFCHDAVKHILRLYFICTVVSLLERLRALCSVDTDFVVATDAVCF